MAAGPSSNGVFAALQRGARWLLIIATAMVVLWAFSVVTARGVHSLLAEHGKTSLVIMHWGDPKEDGIVQTLCDHYMASHPNVSITHINAGNDFASKLKTMLAAGTPPDLFYLQPDTLPELARLKLIEPIDSYVQQAEKTDAALMSDFYPVMLKSFRYDTTAGKTGAGPLYALPKDFTTAVFYVNLDLFKAAGVPVPYSGWTWAEFEADMAKITALNGKPEYAGRKIYGGDLQIWPDTLRALLWSYGADFFGDDFAHVALDSPRAQQCLQMIARMRLQEHTLFNSTGIAKDAGEEFLIGDIGCCGPLGRWKVPFFVGNTTVHWDCVPVPRLDDTTKDSIFFYTGWAMSSQAKSKEQSFELLKFLCGKEGAVLQSQLGLAIPPLQSVANSKDFLSPPGLPPMNSKAFLDAIPYGRVQQNPIQPEWARILGDNITRSIQLGDMTTMDNAKDIQAKWSAVLDSPLKNGHWGPMPWNLVVSMMATALVLVVFGLWLSARRDKIGPLDRSQARSGFFFISPWVVGFLALTLGPMLISLLLSFGQWTGMTPMSDALSVGTANYRELVTNDPTFYQSLKVTVYFVLLAVPIGQIAALAVALLMNSPVKAISVFRTIFFVPSVVSGVALAVLWLQIFNNDYGLLNATLRPLFAIFHSAPPDWFGRDAAVFAIPAFVIMGLWGVGGGMIIYLAGLKGIPGSLYEASRIDGAGPVRRFWNITLPMLSPLLFYNFVMGIIGSFQVFTQAYVMRGPNNSTLFYVLNLYQNAFEFHNMGYASAMAWVLFVIVLLLTIAVFRGSKKLVYYEGLKS